MNDLIQAVEAADANEVRRLLDAGARATAAKRVTITFDVASQIYKFKRDKVERKTDTVDCESALALAIMRAQPEIVGMLLEAGAPPNREIRWKRSAFGTWNMPIGDWEVARWECEYFFPSALTLALGKGGKGVTAATGKVVTIPNSKNILAINLPGGHVDIFRPRLVDDVRVQLQIVPSIEIVRLLLDAGATVTEKELDAAKSNSDPKFLELLLLFLGETPLPAPASYRPPERRESADAPITVTSPSDGLARESSFETATESIATAGGQDTARQLRRLLYRAVDAETRAENAETRCREFEALATRLRDLNEQLVADAESTADQVEDLMNSNEALQSKVVDLESSNAALTAAVKTLQAELQKAHPERQAAAVPGQVSAVPENIKPPIVSEAPTVETADGDGTSEEELSLNFGDQALFKHDDANQWGTGHQPAAPSTVPVNNLQQSTLQTVPWSPTPGYDSRLQQPTLSDAKLYMQSFAATPDAPLTSVSATPRVSQKVSPRRHPASPSSPSDLLDWYQAAQISNESSHLRDSGVFGVGTSSSPATRSMSTRITSGLSSRRIPSGSSSVADHMHDGFLNEPMRRRGSIN
ncbi:hypothetical protein HDU93_002900 [Gonapodya sp. JEL0774]|nr:hypothetical protein HDU93_002900 [Gonapodya sp. JEL0774]